MIDLFQFFDPSNLGPYANTAILVAFYFFIDRRLRRVENHLSRLEGRTEKREVKK